jgi:hypothetical protein
MADEPHDAVKLLLARMDSHPEEFKIGGEFHGRWVQHIDIISDFGNSTDKAALEAKLRDIIMGEVHEQVMDELLNGEDRRRKDEEEAEYERKLEELARKQKILQNNQTAMQKIDTSVFSQANQAAGALSSSINQLKQVLGVKK